MASFFTTALKSFKGNEEEPPKEPPKDGKAATLPNGMAREEFEEYQRQLLEEKCCGDLVTQHLGAERLQEEQVPPTGTFAEPLLGAAAGGAGCGPYPQIPIATLLQISASPSPPAPAWDWHNHAAAGGPGIERDKAFAQKKAERATLRMHMRDKYHLPQDERDDAQVHVVGGTVELPQELAAMVHSEEEDEEEEDDGAFAFLTKLREVNLPALRDRTLGSVDEMKEKCVLM